jgi:hypothetical protein
MTKRNLIYTLVLILLSVITANMFRDYSEARDQKAFHQQYVMIPRKLVGVAEDGSQTIVVRWSEPLNSWTESNVPLATAKTEDSDLYSYSNGKPLQYHDRIWWQP